MGKVQPKTKAKEVINDTGQPTLSLLTLPLGCVAECNLVWCDPVTNVRRKLWENGSSCSIPGENISAFPPTHRKENPSKARENVP